MGGTEGVAAANGGVPYPCVRVEAEEPGRWSGEAVEREAFDLCSQFGDVVDARCSVDGALLVYFQSESKAVEAARRLVGRELGGLYVEDTSTNVANVEVVISGLGAGEKGGQLEVDVGHACGTYGRVLDVWCDGSVLRVAFASVTGAAAAVIALDGASLDGHRVNVALGGESGLDPRTMLRGIAKATDPETLRAVQGEGGAFGAVKSVKAILSEEDCVAVEFEETKAAAACAAALHGRKFDGAAVTATLRVRGADDEFDAAFGLAVVESLGGTPPAGSAPVVKHEDTKPKMIDVKTAMNERLEKAIIALRLAVAKAPEDAKHRANLAGALLRLGGEHNVHQAVNHARHSIAVAPMWPWGHLRLGAALLALGDVAGATAAVALAEKLEPENGTAQELAAKCRALAEKTLDPLDAYCAAEVTSSAQRDLAESELTAKRERESGAYAKSKRLKRDGATPGDSDDDDDDFEMQISSRAHCYVCKQWGHSKKDCPLAKCQYCHTIGHQKKDCTLFTDAIAAATEEEKKARRKLGYEKKKLKKKDEWTRQLRDQAGVEGFEALYRVLGLPERRLATEAEIKKAYHKRSLMYHPDKHPKNREEAHERFLEIKCAYELLLEGIATGGKGFKGAVFKAGELTDAATAAEALQKKVNTLAEKVKNTSAWAG